MVQSPTTPAVRDLITVVGPVLAADDRVLFAYLFGSRTLPDPPPDSDIDLAVHFNDPIGALDEATLHGRLAAVTGHDTDLVVLNRAPLWLAFRVVGDGVVVFSRDEPLRIAHRARIEQEFLDFRPYHDAYLAAVRERARRGALSRG